ncbi:gp58-like family protein [Lactobacillus delbrueckii]|uniref:gp58-like family protein n=1 Tax=Lactobacillus delbrueckii TaxID=1584 RepID=UPI0023E43C37|nr:gp58-like family protein [Lactobacillus delbrueckii]MDF4029090.1 gp58-like family protein [Lactobacillus delbrueckii]
MSESKSASVVFTNGRLLAKNAHKTADNAKSAAEKAQELAYSAQKTADGKNRVFRGSDPATVPTSGLQEGDLYFTDNALYTWTGSAWEKTVSDTTGAEIHAKVEAAMQESQKAVADLKSDVEAKVKNLDDEIAKNNIQTGNALSFYKEQYYLSTSYTELTGGSWSDEVPPRKVEGKYVWSRYVTANVGDPTNQQYSDPVCISGLDGKDGDQGVPGPKGADGRTTYVHFAYANIVQLGQEWISPNFTLSTQTVVRFGDEASERWVYKDLPAGKYTVNTATFDGSDHAPGIYKVVQSFSDFSVTESSGRAYIGQYTDYTQADSTDPASYRWTKIKGETGPTGATGPKGDTGDTGFFIGTTPPPNPTKGTVWATNDSSGNMVSAKTWDGSNWVSTAFTQDLVAGNITASKIVGGELDVNKFTVKNAQNIPIESTVSLGQKLSDMKQDADGLTSTVIGGGNLLNNTTDTLQNVTVNRWMFYTTSSDEPIAKHQLDGQTVTLSAWIENPSKEAWVQMWTDKGMFLGSRIPAGEKGWSQVTYTMPSGFVSWNIVVGCGDGSGTVTLSYSSLQLELGPNRTAWSQSTADIAQLKITADSLNAYVRSSNGSSTLASILSMDPNNSTIGQVVNGHVVAAINTSSDGSVKIDGKTLHITADTKIENAVIKSAMIESIEAEKITTGTLNADKVNIINLTADKIASGTLNGVTIIGSKFIATGTQTVLVDDSGFEVSAAGGSKSKLYAGGLEILTDNNGSFDAPSIDMLILDESGPFIRVTKPGSFSWVGADNIWSELVKGNEGQFANWKFSGSKVLAQSGSLYVANPAGGNFDGNGSVGFQVWSGIGLGKSTIYTPNTDIYIQQGNVGPALGQSYSSANKTTIHCQNVISRVANTVSSRLSVKTDITPVSYDRALAAVEGTEMYDYRYVSDDSGQHYVSGIIDDVNPDDPQYHMDDMLINKERDARIDANLVGYHHVVLQELLKKIDKLQAELTELKSKEK